MACSDNKNPLKRGGTSQQQRLLASMKSGYVNIDERDYPEWIVFAARFGAYLNYYDTSNKISGNWTSFFDSDVSAVLGSIAIQNIDEYRLEIKSRFDILKSDEQTLTTKKATLGALYGAILTLCKALDDYLLKMSDDNPLKSIIQNLIRTKLQKSLQKLLSYYKGGKALLLIKDVDLPDWKVLNTSVVKASINIATGLSSIWYPDATNWTTFYASIPEDKSIYGNTSWEQYRQINHAANHNLFSGLFDQFLMSFSKIIKDSENTLLLTLTSSNGHVAHYTLFLTFLRLFRYAKDNANTLTQRHLDFYYKDVLRLEQKVALPNKAHILIELAKQTSQYLLPKGTLLKAGKDSTGKDVFYSMDKDVVFNKAKVTRLQSVYKGNSTDNFGTVTNDGRLFASPVSNSADGLGADLTTAFKEWHPFVNKKYADGTLSAVTMPHAQIGFALASSNLYLTEGERLVNVKFSPALSTAQLTALTNINCYLTTEKGWYKVDTQTWSSGTIGSASASVLSFTIPGDVPAILNYNAKIHGGLYNCEVPVLKVDLKNEDTSSYKYNGLKDIEVSTIEIEVKVGLNSADSIISGLKNLVLSNDIGVLDPSKPFLPFGPTPKKGDSFIIGNEELFKKKNAQVLFNINWKDLPGTADYIDFSPIQYLSTGFSDPNPKVKAYSLQKGVWSLISDTELKILTDYFVNGVDISSVYSVSNSVIPDTLLTIPLEATAKYTDSYGAYGVTSINGFVKLSLTDTFGHDEYQKTLTKYLIDRAKPTPTGIPGEPTKPYTPTIESLTLHYKSSVTSSLTNKSSFTSREIQFFHLYPFGEAEQHAGINNASSINLFPQFTSVNGSNENVGELYIGLENLQTQQSVAILFQVLDGTTNPLLDKPEEHVSWSYLSNNQWKSFDDQSVSDNTSQLIQSGIITFIIPTDATTENTILSPGYIWLKASVTENAESVCKILSVDAQAATVTFQPNDNAPDFLDRSLPAGSISKLKDISSAIKKISQPYSSFGGRQKETSDQYYVRVSERLRHKSRAITIWDYEHLILEAFPAIHKVKCLNHTRFDGNDYNEIAPGHVTIITILNLVNRNEANPLRPYTNQNVLEEIEQFVKKKISCHVKLNVRNPQFEEVRLQFKLKLVGGLEFNFYRDLLQKEITEFLTPWAYGNATDIELGGKVHKSVLINFIEERSYVDYITDVYMYHRKDETLAAESADTDLIEASTAKSILVSAPAIKHKIFEISASSDLDQSETCVDQFNTTQGSEQGKL